MLGFGFLSAIMDKLRMVAPSLAMLTVYFLFQLWNSRNDAPYDEESGPLNVNTSREWLFLMEEKDLVVVCDFYATWCAPCKRAAPLYTELSNDPKFKKKGVVFRKCNIDTAAPVAVLCKISQMPTFKVFKGGDEVQTVLGWDEDALRTAIKEAVKK
mmetsp:Transcript_22739/g.38476  ORF Transcript_22739/g.38476 Transcript_22739/m.38476 type:complete len:156 (+) Transcript_22739:86-553(+)